MNIQVFSEVIKFIYQLYGTSFDNFEEEAIAWNEYV